MLSLFFRKKRYVLRQDHSASSGRPAQDHSTRSQQLYFKMACHEFLDFARNRNGPPGRTRILAPNRFTLLLWESFSLTLRGVSVSQDHLLLTLPFLPLSSVLFGPHVFGHRYLFGILLNGLGLRVDRIFVVRQAFPE